MKKILMILTIIILTGISCACGSKNVEGKLEDLMTKVYSDIKEENKPMMLTNIEVNEENIEYYLGTKDIEYTEALASESGVGSIAHSVVLVRTKKNANIEKTIETIKDNINPRKWICVGVEEKDVIVKNKGDLIILILIEDKETRELISSKFDNL